MNEFNITLSEIQKFEKIAEEWWDKKGKFRPLHDINPVRIDYITQQITKNLKDQQLSDLSILDVGCGGGLISEGLKQKGLSVTAIDASAKNIDIAIHHAKKSNLDINYRNVTTRKLIDEGKKFDVVLALEVIEHVEDIELFLEELSEITKPQGLIILSTINRTIRAFFLAIIGAEYILNLLPKGTHDFQKFLKPSEINQIMLPKKNILLDMIGLYYNPITHEAKLTREVNVNYMMTFRKNVSI